MLNIKNLKINSYLIVIKEFNILKNNDKWKIFNIHLKDNIILITKYNYVFCIYKERFKYFIDLKTFRKNKLNKLK